MSELDAYVWLRVATKRSVAVLSLTLHLDQPRVADGIDPERMLDLLAQLRGQRAVEQGEERARLGRRQIGGRQHLHRQVEAVARHHDETAVVVVARVVLVDVDQRRDVADGGLRKSPRHRVPVALHEHEGDHALEQHDRCDDDDQRAGVEALGNQFREYRDRVRMQAVDRAPEVGPGRSGRPFRKRITSCNHRFSRSLVRTSFVRAQSV